MAKAPSDATRLRTTQRELRDNYTLLTNARNERDHYRARATKAEQEVAEWRARFDALLYRWCEGSVLALIEALDDERAAADEQKGTAG